ncbi:class I SAM-dependent methyltransferase [Streptomyces sp. NBC_01340]|uniref:class I SAM-dependent methyltransferase n=1 Tax=unclassified Streptomyces TaxID=2593676 RepID=UPI002253DEC0|nr:MULTISPECIES: class I SAM-dependent methyltransferase [unclassified Streptomyces]MCX4454796.1 class I SAM-dependent methyltransferase [Streptomyces sp. NBC_01719]MCX4494156.1 class I SAM-dependent methyltransferase [Streptomyces sp. NBC_01728]MCX4591339.1 class I SAM-dependent methyltransferase [Streptomyces sp. NBC_01549]WSI39217.1 class I SAM-dependent methyltransferase [Streptomyces sp. NBC_01340]
MKILSPRALRALEQFNAAYPWDHNAHYHRWILRQLPRRFNRALDIGSGSGDLARLLAGRAAAVKGIDSDPAITAQAQKLTPAALAVTFTVADAMAEFPADSYDVITCVATIHHLPFTQALTRFRRHLAPGGTLVIVGLSHAQTPVDHLLGALAIPANAAMGWLKNKGRPSPRPVSMTAPTRPADMTFDDIVRETRNVLPGARLRRRLFWRYTLVWHHR